MICRDDSNTITIILISRYLVGGGGEDGMQIGWSKLSQVCDEMMKWLYL